MHKHNLHSTRPARALSTLTAAVLLAGCSFIPHYERPAAPVPPTYPLASASAAAPQSAASIDWKDYFTDPLSLIHI